ncbi:hypothetical protein LAZ67_23000081 [Cordylochernes scorpioides]|uniref:Mariner Mos1 transposase n=1 Tax=Cordylochernes scorpioides TaxID=51811 RepID=A0ABY6LRJ4_9ARAC|nr:hypothetical protein LAZ67_23000081 [Cordylochernes scorpioides]
MFYSNSDLLMTYDKYDFGNKILFFLRYTSMSNHRYSGKGETNKQARVSRTGYLMVALKGNFTLPFSGQYTKPIFTACMPGIFGLAVKNSRTTFLELEQDTGIFKTTIGRIVTEDLKLKKTPAKFIPRFLTNEQKLCRLATCEDMLEMTRTDPEWKDKIITGYETWVYGYYPETKHQSAEWRCQGELRPKKSRLLKSRNKVLLVAFLDKKGIFHHEYLPAGQTVIKDMYLGILRRLREAIRKKRPEKWTNGGWILHHDNARPHTTHLMTSFLAKNGTQILLQPPYFPDIAPNDFFLFPKLKAVLKGRHFDTRDDIIEKSPLALNDSTIGRNDGAEGIQQWDLSSTSPSEVSLAPSMSLLGNLPLHTVQPGLHRLVGRSDVSLSWHRLAGSSTRPEASRYVFSSPQM